ncbi:MAG TPA: glycosyltransferase [Caulobacteraceae bacterium]|jgi:hypothetical protein|nr:glycosyltransferase [Caulobacteraceae bacterium]
MAIPTTLHQLWKTQDVPARFTALRETWRTRNPGWTIRLWTDRDLEDLVASRYPELLEMYRGYAAPICRADLGRYLVLETFGGVYADLDCECLKPLDALLARQDFVIGLEPDEHLKDQIVAASGFTRLLCPTFIASVAGHPFWRHVRGHVVAAEPAGGVLDLTGPFMMTRAYDDYPHRAGIAVPPAPVLYPFNKFQCWDGSVYDLEVWERCSREAFAAHYWDGAWFRAPTPLDGLPWGLSARLNAVDGETAAYPADAGATRISCLTAVNGWSPGLAMAVESYLHQTHPNKELVIVGTGADPLLAKRLGGYPRGDIRLLTVADDTSTPAELRAAGVQAVTGALVCRWDVGELQDPRRLEIQLRVLSQAKAHAGLLARRLAWRPAARRLAITADAPELSSLICQKRFWPREEADPAALRRLLEAARVTTIDLPRLSLKVALEADADAFETDWATASARFEGERCDAVAGEVAKRLPLDLVRRETTEPPRLRRPSPPGEILVLTPIKDGRRHLPRYFELISRLDSGAAPLSVAFLEGDSRDGSFEALQAAMPSLENRFARVEAWRRHDGLEIAGPRWQAHLQRARRAAVARARNRLLAAALGEAEWVLWLDVDVMDYPPDLLLQLLAAGKDIVTPHCVFPNGASFDLNTFILANGRDDAKHLRDGLFQPPRGEGRLYLENVADQDLVRVDSVGGTALLVRGDLHRDGLNFPAYPYGGYIETEGLAMMARDMGHACWALPKLHILHPYDVEAG